MHYIFSSSTGYLIGLLFGYYFNKYWTFNEKVMIGKLYIVKYSIAQLLGLIFSQLLLYFFVESLYLNPLLANGISIGFAAILSFILIDVFLTIYRVPFKLIGISKAIVITTGRSSNNSRADTYFR